MIKCAFKNCNKYFHILCAYFAGLSFDISLKEESNDIMVINPKLKVKIYCDCHQPFHRKSNKLKQIYYRKFIINYEEIA